MHKLEGVLFREFECLNATHIFAGLIQEYRSFRSLQGSLRNPINFLPKGTSSKIPLQTAQAHFPRALRWALRFGFSSFKVVLRLSV